MPFNTHHHKQTQDGDAPAPSVFGVSSQNEQGFTITELLVSIGIMLIITGILVARYSSFNSAVLLKSQALEVGLAIREAQLYAVASQGDSTDYNKRYGVYFDEFDPNTYLLYRDEDDNGRYSGSDVILGSYSIDERFVIRGMVDADDGGNDVTAGDGELSISFKRPNFDAIFYRGNDTPLSDDVVYIEVALSGETGNDSEVLRTVEVTSAGQITVQ